MVFSVRSLASALPGSGLVLLLASGCVEIPEFEIPPVPSDLGAALADQPGNCSPGGFECACRPDDSCDAGLACVEDLCQTSGSSGDGDGDPSPGDGDGDGDPSTGDGDGDGDPMPDCVSDEDCPDAHLCSVDGCELAANLAFVTSQAYAPTFGGLAGADALCSEAAQAAGHTGEFIALLGDSQTSLTQRVEGASGWVRTDLRNVANDPYDLTNGELFYPLTHDEFGTDIGGVPVYTGGIENADHCNDWSWIDPMDSAGLGYSADGSHNAINDSYVPCDAALAHLYCVQIDKRWAGQPPTPPSYRTAFTSTTYIGPGPGIAYMDDTCQTEAEVFGLADNGEVFKAWIAQPGASANSRFDLDGPPWVRVDGTMIVEVGTDLADPSRYLAPITVAAEGWHADGEVWTGATGPEVPGDLDSTCGGWMAGQMPGSVGRVSRLDEQFGIGTANCLVVNPVYCLQE